MAKQIQPKSVKNKDGSVTLKHICKSYINKNNLQYSFMIKKKLLDKLGISLKDILNTRVTI